MHISLVLATYGRTTDLERFLASLAAQTYRDFDLIVIDQNPDARLDAVLGPYAEQFALQHLRTTPGTSHARNVGLEHVSGDIVAFPDDDCWYPPGLLEQVEAMLQHSPEWDGVCGLCRDEEGRHSVSHWDAAPGPITKYNVWHRGTAATVFMRRYVAEAVGRFDERMGGGAPWASGEDIDYIIRAVEAGYYLRYDPDLVVHHPLKMAQLSHDEAAERSKAYAMGMALLLRKHNYPLWYVGYYLLRALAGYLVASASRDERRARIHAASFRGRLQGWRDAKSWVE